MPDGTQALGQADATIEISVGSTGAPPSDWRDEVYLHWYPDVAAAVRTGHFRNGFCHYVRHGKQEGRLAPTGTALERIQSEFWCADPSSEPTAHLRLDHIKPCVPANAAAESIDCKIAALETIKTEFSNKTTLPKWAVDEMFILSAIDPGLDLPAYSDKAKIYNPFEWNFVAEVFHTIAEKLRHRSYDVLFFVPWLKTGGADLAALWHISSASERYSRIAVFATEGPFAHPMFDLPETVELIEIGGFIPHPDILRAKVFYHLICGLRPSRVHVLNSYLGWCGLRTFAGPLSRIVRLYASLWCYDYTETGEPVGYARDIRSCADHLEAVFTDNTPFKGHLAEHYGIAAHKIHVLRHPVRSRANLAAPELASGHVLWASRLDRQKQPLLLCRIARALPSLRFVAYGSNVVEPGDDVLAAFAELDNVSYQGPYSEFDQICSKQFRCFLYTSRWDGLPNVILEAMSAGMLVVGPRVGGLGADISRSHAVLVNDPCDSNQYVEALRWVFANPAPAEQIRCAGRDFVRAHYTFEGFTRALISAGYLEEPRTSGPSAFIEGDEQTEPESGFLNDITCANS